MNTLDNLDICICSLVNALLVLLTFSTGVFFFGEGMVGKGERDFL